MLSINNSPAAPGDYSPDGSVIASGGDDNSIMLWDASTGKLEAKMEGHRAAVISVRFSADGSMIMSADRNGVSHGWDLIPAFEQSGADRSKCVLQ